jgi:hypothetical protein
VDPRGRFGQVRKISTPPGNFFVSKHVLFLQQTIQCSSVHGVYEGLSVSPAIRSRPVQPVAQSLYRLNYRSSVAIPTELPIE